MISWLSIARRASVRYLGRHPWLTGLSVLGIALGVAVVVSIDLANSSAERAFQLSASRVAGETTHQIVTAGTVSDELYERLRVDEGVRPSAPIVEGFVRRGGRTFQVLGIDPFADRAFRPYTSDLADLDLGAFMGEDLVVLVPPTVQKAVGDTLHLSTAGGMQVVNVGGVLIPQDAVSQEATANLLIADIGTAQRLFGLGGQLSRIDLILESEAAAERIEEMLPVGARIVRSSTRTETIDQMTAAFELNLDALSLLALVVAVFLIYNTLTFSVVQRRPLLGRLRAIGVTRRELFVQILIEALLMGIAGSVIGLLMGIVMAQGLVRLVTQTINDLYYVLEVQSVRLDAAVLGKALLLGVGATVAAAAAPAREAASSPVQVVMQRSVEEERMRRLLPRLSLAGGLLGLAAIGVLWASGTNLVVSYLGLALILAAFALVAPAATRWLARASRRLLGGPFGLVGRMASQGVVHNLSRTSVAIAALSIAVAAAVGVGVMVGSFRDTVTDWLDYTLQADVYVQPPSAGARLGQGVLDEALAARLADLEGVRQVSSVRRLDLTLEAGRINLAAVDPGPDGGASYRYTSGDAEAIWAAFRSGDAVLVSEPLAYRTGLAAGDSLRLPTDRGERPFAIAGVFYDYASDQGTALMLRSTFTRYFNARGLSGISLHLDEAADIERISESVQRIADTDVVVRSNRALRTASLEIFDRTFAITTVLRVLALFVACAGVVSALMALQIERANEFAILRAEGMTPRLLRRYVTLQTGVMGAVAGVLAVPLGLVLAYVLIFVINKRSFGWTLDFSVPPGVLMQAFGLALLAAVLAGIYPALELSRTNTADALRSE